jgi:hypothetical protein
MSVMEIRTYRESDRDAMRDLFDRPGEGSPTASLWRLKRNLGRRVGPRLRG